MKKAVAHLIPFMEKEREKKLAQLREEGKAEEADVSGLGNGNLVGSGQS